MLPARWLCRIKGPAPAGCQRVHDDRVRRRPRRTPRVQPGRHGPRLYGHYARALDEGPAPRSAKSSPPPATSCDIRPGPASRLSASTRSPRPQALAAQSWRTKFSYGGSDQFTALFAEPVSEEPSPS